MTDLPFLSDLERLAKAAIAIRQNLDARFATSATDVLSLIAALREAEGDAKCYSDAAKMWREQCEEARARLSSIRSAMLSEEAVTDAAKAMGRHWQTYGALPHDTAARVGITAALDKAGI